MLVMRPISSFVPVLLVACSVIAGCGGSSDSGTSAITADPFKGVSELQTELLVTITDETSPSGEGEERFFFTSDYFHQMAFGPGGSIFVSNAGERSIMRFDAGGDFQGAIGQEGEGPGEFQIWPFFDPVSPDSLLALDFRKSEAMLFTRNGENWSYHDGFRLDNRQGYRPERIHYLPPNRVAIEYRPAIGLRLSVVEQDTQIFNIVELRSFQGEVIEKNWLEVPSEEIFAYRSESGRGGATTTLPYGSRSLLDAGPDGRMYQAWSRDFSLSIYGLDGTVIDSIRHASVHTILGEEIRQHEVEEGISVNMGDESEQRNMMEQFAEAIPTEAPALRDMHVDRDNGRIIVRRYVFEEDAPNWMLLDADGTRLGSFRLSENLEVHDFRHGNILGAVSGDEMVPTVQVFTLGEISP